jgi:hypothetical protein
MIVSTDSNKPKPMKPTGLVVPAMSEFRKDATAKAPQTRAAAVHQPTAARITPGSRRDAVLEAGCEEAEEGFDVSEGRGTLPA